MDSTTPPTTVPTASVDDAMRAAGVEPYEQVGQADYFGGGSLEEYTLPDGVSTITLKEMNEGDRRRYQNGVNRDVRVQKATGDAILQLSQADERHSLLKATIVGWNLIRAGAAVPFTSRELDAFLASAPTKIIDGIEKRARELNPWLLADMTVEDIDAEIANLEKMREDVARAEEGKAV